MIKNEKGITLVVLAITIIVMTILATVVTYSALDSLRTAQKNAFISEMEMVQAKVNVIYEKMQNNTQDIEYYNSLGQDVSVLGEETLIKILGDSSRDGFKYFSKEDLKNLELEDINQEVIINFSTREVISTRGIKIGGVMYYKLSNIPNYKGHNIDYINKNTEAPTFEIEQTKLESGWKFTIKNIKYNSNVEGGTLSYKLHNDTNWIIAGQDTSFIATKPGIYDIKFTDKAGNSTTMQEGVYVQEGLLVHYDAINNTGNGHSDTTIIWKDLSGNGNDAIISGATWNNTYLAFDGVDDIAYTKNDLNFNSSQAVTVEFVFVNNNFDGVKLLFELTEDSNKADCGFYIDTGEYGTKDLTFAMKYDTGKNINHKMVDEILEDKVANYTLQFDSTKTYDNFISIYKNSQNYTVKNVTGANAATDLSKRTLINHKLYIGGRQGADFYSNMNLMAVRVYNRILTQSEIQDNYEVDQYRFGITE